ncbi:FliH/SctL family protein [Profundibacter amoris]|uniref:Flagellar biosynthesis protein n=1 Tax=Profundibacter amoris TaxID=2171755 RepID=A0A347UL68_9RHOB|nr:flagellar biosynthesis protein [Profundibacter amoris]AXX99596.1 flagellar biosynthesis protein [Profundibacter amoris]
MAVFPLEEFNTTIVSNDPKLTLETSFEEHRLEAYEQGYKAGWDDATAAQIEEQYRVAADFARNLQELSFTYHEARNQILGSLKPLFTEMVSKVLPRLAQETLPQSIVDEVLSAAADRTIAEFEIVISPANRPALERLLEDQTALDVNIVEEPTMAEGLAYIRFSETEKQIDLTSVLAGFSQLVEGFFTQQQKVAING